MDDTVINHFGKYLISVLMAGGLAACDGGDTKITERDPIRNPDPVDPPHAHSESGARLLVTRPGAHDHVLVYELEENVAIADLQVEGAISALHASPSNRYAIAVQGASGLVNFIDSGVEWEQHGDHGHIHLSDPTLADLSLAGTKPAHVTKHGNRTVIFFDGDETVPAAIQLVDEAGIGTGTVLAQYEDEIHQHGAAQAWGDHLLATARDGSLTPATTLPTMVKLSELHSDHFHDIELFDAAEHACPGLHGSAQNSGHIVFGCSDGVLTIEPQGDEFQVRKISHETRISSLFGHPHVADFVGAGRNSNDDPVSLFAVSPGTDTITAIDFDGTPRAYGFAHEGELFLILDTEGGLTALDTTTWNVAGERLQVTSSAEAEGETFRLTVSGDGEQAYIADAGAQRILVVDIHGWNVDSVSTIELDFVPGPILWLGAVGEDGHEH